MFQSRAIEVWKRVVRSIHGYIWGYIYTIDVNTIIYEIFLYGYAIDVDTMWRIVLPLCHIHIHLRGEILVD